MNLGIANFVIAILALLISGFIFVRDYIMSGKVLFDVGDMLLIVTGDRNKVQIILTSSNPRNNLAVINHLEGLLASPNGNNYSYKANIFFKIEVSENTIRATPSGPPVSISVRSKGSVLQPVEFIADDRFTWTEGLYKFIVEGWSNRSMNKKRNATREIQFVLTQSDVEFLKKEDKIDGVPTSLQVRIRN